MIDVEKFTAGLHDYMARALKPLAERVKALEDRAPAKGEKGDPGPRGEPGRDADPVPLDDVTAALLGTDELRTLVDLNVAEAVADHLSRNPPERGEKGDPGRDGKDGDSVSVEDVERMVQARVAEWALDFERRAQGVLERAVERIPKPEDGKPGKDGRDGADGFGLDDLSIEDDGERSVTLRFVRGDLVREHVIRLPHVIDRGVHKSDADYLRGDGVTFGGSWWIAQKDHPEDKPGQGDGWRLAVKKGRDGRDGKDGERGAPGRDGKGALPQHGGPY